MDNLCQFQYEIKILDKIKLLYYIFKINGIYGLPIELLFYICILFVTTMNPIDIFDEIKS